MNPGGSLRFWTAVGLFGPHALHAALPDTISTRATSCSTADPSVRHNTAAYVEIAPRAYNPESRGFDRPWPFGPESTQQWRPQPMPMRPSAQHEVMILPSKCLLDGDALALLKTSASYGLPIFLKANHQLESRMHEICQSGSVGGAKSTLSLPLCAPESTHRQKGESPFRTGTLACP